jgi:hypothetical protein
MRLVPYQEIAAEKIKRQRSIPSLELHASGHCIHVGKISPGCRGCFTPEISMGIQVGAKCMMKCPYCYYDPARGEQSRVEMDSQLADLFARGLAPNWNPIIFALQSTGETLLYMDELEKFVKVIKEMEPRKKRNFYLYLYTNGLLANKENLERLKEWGVAELRFHLSASDFSEEAYKNLETAISMGFTGTVELPSLPHNREKIMGMLPRINDLGVKHLDLVECQITPWNREAMHRMYPDGRCYQDYFIHFYDEGLVYDVIEEKIDKGYGFSVIDCNSGVERSRHGPGKRVMFDMKSADGMCAEWNYYGAEAKQKAQPYSTERR